MGRADAIYRAPKLKPGASYRLVIGWDPLDSANKNKISAERVTPSGNLHELKCVWVNPSGGKRYFIRLPAQFLIHVQRRQAFFTWKDISIFTMDCVVDLQASEFTLDGTGAGEQLALKATVVRSVTAPAIPSAASTRTDVIHSFSNAPTTPLVTDTPINAPSVHPAADPLLLTEVAAILETASTAVPARKRILGTDKVDQASAIEAQASPLASSISTAFPTLLGTLEGFMKIGGLITQVHPMVAAAWSLINGAYQVIRANDALDDMVQEVIKDMNDVCEVMRIYTIREGHNTHSMNAIIQAVLRQIVQGAYTLTSYGEAQSQRFSALKTYFSSLQEEIQGCSEGLKSLSFKLSQHATAEILSKVDRLYTGVEHLSL